MTYIFTERKIQGGREEEALYSGWQIEAAAAAASIEFWQPRRAAQQIIDCVFCVTSRRRQ